MLNFEFTFGPPFGSRTKKSGISALFLFCFLVLCPQSLPLGVIKLNFVLGDESGVTICCMDVFVISFISKGDIVQAWM